MGFANLAKFPTAIAGVADLLNWQNKTPSLASPTLSAGIGTTDTSFILSTGGGSQLPTDNFVVATDNEIMFVSTRTGDTLSGLTRGYEGTTAAAHLSGTIVEARVTAWAHNQLASEINAIESQLGTSMANVVLVNGANALTGKLVLAAAVVGAASLKIPTATGTPTSPVAGDIIFASGTPQWYSGSAWQTPEIQSNKGAVSGYCPLDSGSKVPTTNLPAALAGSPGVIQLATDLGGTNIAPKVVGLQGNPVSTSSPALGNSLIWNGSQWVPTANGVARYSNTAPSSAVTNTITETALFSFLVNSADFYVGRVLDCWLFAVVSTASSSPGGLTLRFEFQGASTLLSIYLNPMAVNLSNAGLVMQVRLIVDTVSSSGTAEVQGVVNINGTALPMVNTSTVSALNLTVNQTVQVTAQWDTALVANSITGRQFVGLWVN